MSTSHAQTTRGRARLARMVVRSVGHGICLFVALAMLCAGAGLHASPSVEAERAARDVLRLMSSGAPCSPNDRTMAIDVPFGGCIAKHVRATRGGYLSADCLNNLRVPATPTGWPRYEKDECKGNGKIFQAEGVAQARWSPAVVAAHRRISNGS